MAELFGFVEKPLTPRPQTTIALGGLPADAANRDPERSPYTDLPRPSSLPPLPRLEVFSKKEVENAFMALWNGESSVRFTEVESCRQLKLEFWLEDGQTNPEFCETALVTLDVFEILVRRDGPNAYELDIHSFSHVVTKSKKSFAETLTMDQIDVLEFRLLHMFLRNYGAAFSITSSTAKFLLRLYEASPKKYLVESLDVAVMLVDFAHSQEITGTTVLFRLVHLGEVLEANGEFHLAAQVYIASLEHARHDEDRAASHRNAGLAFKRSNIFESAESSYVEALYWERHQHQQNWNLNSDPSATTILNMMNLYYTWTDQTATSPVHFITGRKGMVQPLFMALVYCAGFHGCAVRFPPFFHEAPTYCDDFLKPKYKTRGGAMDALVLATSTPDVQNFQSVLFGCLRNKDAGVYCVGAGALTSKTLVKDSKRAAREQLASAGSVSNIVSMGMCDNIACKKTGRRTEFLQCPCRLVLYCNKACQLAQWKTHKKACLAKRKHAK